MGSKDNNDCMVAIQLTVDLKPDLPSVSYIGCHFIIFSMLSLFLFLVDANSFLEIVAEEAERIKRCKGRVFALQDEPEVCRVWLPFDDAPGLAMARAFGDFCLKDYGVISIPEFSHRQLTDRDQFIVLASDGVRIIHLIAFNVFPCSLHFFQHNSV